MDTFPASIFCTGVAAASYQSRGQSSTCPACSSSTPTPTNPRFRRTRPRPYLRTSWPTCLRRDVVSGSKRLNVSGNVLADDNGRVRVIRAGCLNWMPPPPRQSVVIRVLMPPPSVYPNPISCKHFLVVRLARNQKASKRCRRARIHSMWVYCAGAVAKASRDEFLPLTVPDHKRQPETVSCITTLISWNGVFFRTSTSRRLTSFFPSLFST